MLLLRQDSGFLHWKTTLAVKTGSMKACMYITITNYWPSISNTKPFSQKQDKSNGKSLYIYSLLPVPCDKFHNPRTYRSKSVDVNHLNENFLEKINLISWYHTETHFFLNTLNKELMFTTNWLEEYPYIKCFAY